MTTRAFPWLLAILLASLAGVPRASVAHSQATGRRGVVASDDSRDLRLDPPIRADLSTRSEPMPAEVDEKPGGGEMGLAAPVGLGPYAMVLPDLARTVAPTIATPTLRIVVRLLC